MNAARDRGRGEGRGIARWIVVLLAGVLAAAASAVAFAPASFADLALERATRGRVRLAEAEGSIWHGAGRLVLQDVTADDAGPAGAGMALPSRVRWRLQPLPLVLGLAQASLSFDGSPAAIPISGSLSELRVGAGALDLPDIDLSRLGSPWNTIRPVASVSLRWDALAFRDGVPEGRASIELRDTASAMTQVRPLGSYRIDVVGSGGVLALSLATLGGALQLQGSGRFTARTGLSFNAQAWADGPQRPQLQSLLALIGRREGERTVIRIGG